MAFSFEQQLEIINIIDRLVKPDSNILDCEDALRLRTLVLPNANLKPESFFSLTLTGKSSGGGSSNAWATGAGHVQMDDEEDIEKAWGVGSKIICGRWELSLGKKQGIYFCKQFDSTRDLEDQQGYQIKYSKDGSAVLALLKLEPYLINALIPLLSISLSISMYKKFKVPSNTLA